MASNNPEMAAKITEDRKEYVEEFQPSPESGSEKGDSPPQLTPAHREYLIQRHGTVDLDPIPDMGDADPYNWPQWMKVTNLTLVALHACMSTFTAAAINPAYASIAADLSVSIQDASYLTSLQIAILGVAPLFWKPFSNTFGRRPLFLLSLICSLVGNIGCAKSPTYATMAICRALVAFFIAPAGAIGSGVVTETFFKKDRARYIGVWALMVTLGVPLSPFVCGFVAYHVGYRWIYYILAMINGVQLILYFFFGPETRYIRSASTHQSKDRKKSFFKFSRIDPAPLTVSQFYHPLTLATKPSILLPTFAYAMTFLFASVLITVELPQLFGEKFSFNAQQLGLQFLGVIVGSVIGEQLGGSLSDYWMNRHAHKTQSTPPPEYRLWLSYSGFILTIIGMVVFLVQTANAPQNHWNITPVVGIAIAGVGNQIVTTVLITYMVDCYPGESASVGVFVTFVRQIWGFIGPFWFPAMFESVGISGSAGVAAGLLISCSILPVMFVQWRGSKLRRVAKRTEGMEA